jgi:hypothetical protein
MTISPNAWLAADSHGAGYRGKASMSTGALSCPIFGRLPE